MTGNEKLIKDALTAFADREVPAPSREHLRIALDTFLASLTLCGCDACTAARQEHTGITDHDRTALARVLHQVVYAPGANFDRAAPGVQEHMIACAEKVAAALPWLVPTSAPVFEKAHTPTAGSCWDAAPQITRAGVHDPMPTLCELTAGHLGAHRNGVTEWMHRPELQGEPSDDVANAVARAIIEHDEDRLTCYDHPEEFCCPCGEHGMGRSEWQRHRARAALRAASSAVQGQSR